MPQPLLDGFPERIQRIVALADCDPRRGVLAAKRVVESSDPGLTVEWGHFALAWALLCWERFDEARSLFETTRVAAEEALHQLVAARCRFGLVLTNFFQRPHAGLVLDLEATAVQLERVGALREAAHAHVMQAALLNLLGQAPEALALLERLAEQGGAGQDAGGARWRRVRAATAYSLGDYAGAAGYLDEAALLFAGLGYRADLAKCWYEQGALAIRAAQYDGALGHYRRADRVFMRLDLPFRRALCAHDSSHALIRLGAYDKALDNILPALAYFTSIGRTRDIARCYLLLGNIFWFTASWDAGLASYRSAEELFATTGMVAGDRLTARRNQALVYRRTGRLDEAWAMLQELERAAVLLEAEADLAAIRHDQAALLAASGQETAALARYQSVQLQLQQLGNLAAAAASRLEQGWLLLARGDIAEARATFRAAAADLAAQPHSRWRNDYGLARCAEAQGEHVVALAHYLRACSTVADLRGRLASEAFSSTIFLQAEELYLAALRLAVRLGDAASVLAIGEAQRALALRRRLADQSPSLSPAVRAQYEALLAQIRQITDPQDAQTETAVPQRGALTAFGELLLGARSESLEETLADALDADVGFDLERTRRRLSALYGSSWTALVYLPLDDMLVIVMLAPDSLLLSKEPYDGNLRHLLGLAFRRNYRRYTYDDLAHLQGQTVRPWETLWQLGDRLIPPGARARLGPSHRLIVIPGGELHMLPWAALRLSEGWLVERAIIQLAPSLTTPQRLGEVVPTAGRVALLIGCGTFQGRAPDLPGVPDEVAAVAMRLDTPFDILVDADASCAGLTERGARGELARYSLLHIASHAQMLSKRGRAAHLKLWDDDLGLGEIARLKLGGALVVLSACEGADAELLPGEEVLSLSRAFIAAGARAVIASLWPVYDQAAIALMGRFYSHLKASGDAVLALALAQRELAGSAPGAADLLASPRCWASFLIMGAS